MAQIYSDAYVTILASSAGDAAHGFLAHRYENDEPVARIPFRVAPDMFGSITARQYVPRSSSVKKSNPLSTRAWALQEQMMASRLLDYTKHTLVWRCASSMMSLNNSLMVDPGDEPVPKLISQLSTDPEKALREWSRIVQDYSHRDMSIESDKLPAIAALAQRFSAIFGPHYYAGLWRYGLMMQLCWTPTHPSQKQRAGSLYRAPSWSWASVDGTYPRYKDGNNEEDCCKLASAVALPKNAQVPYGEVVHASIEICGKVAIASVTRPEVSHPMFAPVHYESEAADPPLQRFYRTYFHQATESTVISQRSGSRVQCSWDHKEFRSDPLIVCKFTTALTTSIKQF